MVAPLPIKRDQDIAEVKRLIEEHIKLTGSTRAKKILENWEKSIYRFIRVIPKERAELEAAEEEHEAATNPHTSI